VKTSRMKNITAFKDGSYFDTGMGINIEAEKMYFYAGLSNSYYSSAKTALFVSFFNWFLIKNTSSFLSAGSVSQQNELKAILNNGGITQKP